MSRRENFQSCIHITLMRSATVRRRPLSNSKTLQPLRTAERTTLGSGLGRPRFLDFRESCATTSYWLQLALAIALIRDVNSALRMNS